MEQKTSTIDAIADLALLRLQNLQVSLANQVAQTTHKG